MKEMLFLDMNASNDIKPEISSQLDNPTLDIVRIPQLLIPPCNVPRIESRSAREVRRPLTVFVSIALPAAQREPMTSTSFFPRVIAV